MKARLTRRTEAKALHITHAKQKECGLNKEIKQFSELMSTGKVLPPLAAFYTRKQKEFFPEIKSFKKNSPEYPKRKTPRTKQRTLTI